ncbi:ANTAR domain-containing protein [Mycobacterium sp. PS03-16]|uniref:GAF and ANTAR domain-containing protein n=1 Tax=Mycobacterium sp. PS03-16 TaxID=2559611 RepID=UPI001073CACA|nr:GAF and ANTAR domain-containing protein [Mycobacterium sp. PS03-16]TFV61166.1 ANTAR domain-containing protein [Mycobacterium sp. PS03-16]
MTGTRDHDVALRMAELARSVALPRSIDDILTGVTTAAKDLIHGVDAAGILLVGRNGNFETLAQVTDLPHKLDELQMKFGEGPCVQAALQDTIVRTDDFRDESRWPQYAPACVEMGVLSGLSFKLYTADRTAGALNLFGFEPDVWNAEAETIGTVLAAHAAAAVLASRQEEQLQSALSTRDRIGQAKGIIMERYKVDDVQAFEMMRRLSQDSNKKLTEIAQQVIDTRG